MNLCENDLPVDTTAKCNTAIETDVDFLAKLCEEGFERGLELEAFAGCEIRMQISQKRTRGKVPVPGGVFSRDFWNGGTLVNAMLRAATIGRTIRTDTDKDRTCPDMSTRQSGAATGQTRTHPFRGVRLSARPMPLKNLASNDQQS